MDLRQELPTKPGSELVKKQGASSQGPEMSLSWNGRAGTWGSEEWSACHDKAWWPGRRQTKRGEKIQEEQRRRSAGGQPGGHCGGPGERGRQGRLGGGEEERASWETLKRRQDCVIERQSHLPHDGTRMTVLKYVKTAPTVQIPTLFTLSNLNTEFT